MPANRTFGSLAGLGVMVNTHGAGVLGAVEESPEQPLNTLTTNKGNHHLPSMIYSL